MEADDALWTSTPTSTETSTPGSFSIFSVQEVQGSQGTAQPRRRRVGADPGRPGASPQITMALAGREPAGLDAMFCSSGKMLAAGGTRADRRRQASVMQLCDSMQQSLVKR
jgi:hypothetical protein